jgi:nitrogen fixation protein NifU and related proteins
MNIYQEEILEHYHNPSNYGKLPHATHKHCGLNPTCGDKICIDLIVSDDTIENITFHGEGCAISQAAASMLTESIKDKSCEALKKLSKDDILEMLGVELSMNRVKCGLLALETAQRALGDKLNDKEKV